MRQGVMYRQSGEGQQDVNFGFKVQELVYVRLIHLASQCAVLPSFLFTLCLPPASLACAVSS